MNRWHGLGRTGATLLLPLLAVTLGCSISNPSLPGVNTTQVASTLAAVAATAGGLAPTAEAALTQSVGPTADALLTQAANTAPTLAAEATNLAPTLQAVGTNVAPTVAAAETSVATVVTGAGTQASSGGTPVSNGTAVDVCSLMTTDEASAIAGGSATTTTAVTRTCLYYNPAITITGVSLYVLPVSQLSEFVGEYVPAIQATGVTLDQATVDKLTKDAAAGDMVASVADLQTLLSGVKDYQIQPIQGVSSAAFWYMNTTAQFTESALYAAKPSALVVLSLRSASTTQGTAAQPQMETIVKRILNNLPDTNFTVASTP